MEGLLIKNPYALLVANGTKDILNKEVETLFRGRVQIISPPRLATDLRFIKDLLTPEQFEVVNTYEVFSKVLGLGHLTSCVLGEVDIVDCVEEHPSIWAKQFLTYKPWHWVLANAELYKKPISITEYLNQ